MLIFVQGDTAPDLLGTIHDADDTEAPVDLTDATVRFQMRRADDRKFTINAPAEILDAAEGKVRYRWSVNDLSYPGDYVVQWEVTYPDSRVQTTATGNTITVRRQ
jgi:hypothetical protein